MHLHLVCKIIKYRNKFKVESDLRVWDSNMESDIDVIGCSKQHQPPMDSIFIVLK